MAAHSVEPTWLVYKITCSVNQKSYIGITKRGTSVRWRMHVFAALNPYRGARIPLFHRAIRKYGKEAFEIEVLCSANSIDEANEIEKRMIAAHNTMRPAGYNSTIGGDGVRGLRKPTKPSTIEKLRAANIGKKMSEESKRKMSERKKGGKLTEGHRAKLGAARRGKRSLSRSIGMLRSLLVGKDPISGFKGVRPDGKKWMARMKMNGKTIFIGNFITKEDASLAYQAAVKKRIDELEKVLLSQNTLPSARASPSKPL